MDRKGVILAGSLAVAGAAAYFFSTKGGKKSLKSIKAATADFADEVLNKLESEHKELRNSFADNVYNFAVKHKPEISNIAATVAPFLLKSFVKNKL